jgi:hypothetical protein
MDYSIFYKEEIAPDALKGLSAYDLFISAYDGCERTLKIFEEVQAKEKVWLLFPHYSAIAINSISSEQQVYSDNSFKEDEYFLKFFEKKFLSYSSICIDITGFIRPHLIYLLKYLSTLGISKVDLLYTEPNHYKNADDTTFSGFIDEIRLVEGCSAIDVNPDTENDILIISAGYDDNLIAKVSQAKRYCKKKFYIIGFPSLQPDMYQESILKLHNAKESIGANMTQKFAPAYDPFITAQKIEEILNENPNATNIYLSPLSTKPQTVGIALYYIWSFKLKPVNIIFPFSKKYTSKNAIGVKKTWKYTFEFPAIK